MTKAKNNKNTYTKPLLNGRYEVYNEHIGEGSFGKVFKAFDTIKKIECAIKREKDRSRDTASNEDKIYSKIKNLDGFLQKLDYFTAGTSRYVVFNLVDSKDLLDHMRECKGKAFDLKTTIMVAKQMVSNIQRFHDKGYIHRDIKPENTAMGINQDAAKVFTLDLGIAKKYNQSFFNRHHSHAGNPKYASLNSHNEYDLSRRDDLESLAYNFIYMLKGSLPWENIHGNNRWHKIHQMKSMSTTVLCQGLPPEFREILKYAKKLKFIDRPDYDHVIGLLDRVALRENLELDNIYPWTTANDPAMVEKRKKIEQQEYIAKRRRELARHKRLAKKFKFPATTCDKFFSDQCGLSLEQKQAIIQENMRDQIHFPNLAPPLYLPKRTVEPTSVVPENKAEEDELKVIAAVYNRDDAMNREIEEGEIIDEVQVVLVDSKDNAIDIEKKQDVGEIQAVVVDDTFTEMDVEKNEEADEVQASVVSGKNNALDVEKKQEVCEAQAIAGENKKDDSMDVNEKKEEIVAAIVVDNKDDLLDSEKKQEVDEAQAVVTDNKKDDSMDVDEKKEEIVAAIVVDNEDDLMDVQKKQAEVVTDNNSKDNAMDIVKKEEVKAVVMDKKNDLMDVETKGEGEAAAAVDNSKDNNAMDLVKKEEGNAANQPVKKISKKKKNKKGKAVAAGIMDEPKPGEPRRKTNKEKQAELVAQLQIQVEEEKKAKKEAEEYRKQLESSQHGNQNNMVNHPFPNYLPSPPYFPSHLPTQPQQYNNNQFMMGQPMNPYYPQQPIHQYNQRQPGHGNPYTAKRRNHLPPPLPSFDQKQIGLGATPMVTTFKPVFGAPRNAPRQPVPPHMQGYFLF